MTIGPHSQFEFGAPLKFRLWQAQTFAELGFLAELAGDRERARAELAVAHFLVSLDDPTLRYVEDELRAAFARLETVPAPP